MKFRGLHTEHLEAIFGPIRLHIVKQENNLRIVHLYDEANISRTLGIVRFVNYSHPLLNGTHLKIVAGNLLGQTLLEAKIPYLKSTISSLHIKLPGWLQNEFRSNKISTLALYSHISILEEGDDAPFLYADLFEILTPEILEVFTPSDKTETTVSKDMITLLNLAGITNDQIIKP